MAPPKKAADRAESSSRSTSTPRSSTTRASTRRSTPATSVYAELSSSDESVSLADARTRKTAGKAAVKREAADEDASEGSDWEMDSVDAIEDEDDEDAMLQEAIRLSTQTQSQSTQRRPPRPTGRPEVDAMVGPGRAAPEQRQVAAAAATAEARLAAGGSGYKVNVKQEEMAMMPPPALPAFERKPKVAAAAKGKGKAAVNGRKVTSVATAKAGLKRKRPAAAGSDDEGGFVKDEPEDSDAFVDTATDSDDDADLDSLLSDLDSLSDAPSSVAGSSKAKASSAPKKKKSSVKVLAKKEQQAAELAVLHAEYAAELEKSRQFQDINTKKRLSKLVKAISAIEQASVRKKQRRLKRELGRKLNQFEKNQIALWEYHPELETVWGDLEADIPIIAPVQMPAPEGLRLSLLPFQRESLYWMKEQEKGVWKGGMLADEMGMGKTIQTISLMLSDNKTKSGPNLVLAPVVALRQWKSEIETHAEGLKVLIWHGTGRGNSKASELTKYDVVLTSYGTLQSSWTKESKGWKRGTKILTEKSLPHKIDWHRIILDEAHNIKDRNTNVAKACFNLKGQFKWCLSGTPLQNRVGELYSLVRFLGGDPYSYYFCKNCPCKSLHWRFSNKANCDECGHNPTAHVCLWNNEILNPIVKLGTHNGFGKSGWKKLKLLLDRMMLRRTKLERADDLGLPPRTLVVRRDYFSPEEKEIYSSLFSDVKRQFSSYIAAGTVLNNYSNIFSLITRMRQASCHPDLVLRSKTATYIEDLDETTLCRICQEVGEDVIKAKCGHCFDRECISTYLTGYGAGNQGGAPCPVCNASLTIDLEADAIDLDESNVKKARQGILGRLDVANWRSSTKVEALVEELSKLRAEDVTTKSLVFSQFVSFLDIIAFRLNRAGFKVCRLEGGMTMEARQATIDKFTNSPDVCVFLISLKAGGVALNLTEANRVYLMDSWWNPAVEYQAMDRIHRLGQHRPVTVIKMVIEDSIESKIVQLQEKKLAMTDATLNSNSDAMGKLTAEDLGFLFRL